MGARPLSRNNALVLVAMGFLLITTVLFIGLPSERWHRLERLELKQMEEQYALSGLGGLHEGYRPPPPPQCPGADMIRKLEKKWGKAALRMSVAHGGSGARMQRMLHRFRQRKKIVIGIVGGSIAAGHAMEEGGPKMFAEWLEEGLKEVYPDAVVEVHNSAIGATGTDYYSACYAHHVPVDSDLFILEGAVNDLAIERNGGDDANRPDIVSYTERLVREMLSSPHNPAILMLSTWVVPGPDAFQNGADRHAVVSEYYDIPRLSMRSFLYPYLSQHRDELSKFYGTGSMDHPLQEGHEYLSDIMLHYILTNDCMAREEDDLDPFPEMGGDNLWNTLDPYAVPPLRTHQKLEEQPYTNSKAVCMSANVRLDGDRAQLQPSFVRGWEETYWNGKHYWTSTVAGSKITFSDIEVNGGQLGLYYLRGWNLALGNMRCWADNDEDKAVKLTGFWQYINVGSVGPVADGLSTGLHSVSCVVLDEIEDHNGIEGTNRVSIIAVLAA